MTGPRHAVGAGAVRGGHMTAYYNEIDPFAAAWLRELIRAGEIAPGDVDERSIEDVTPSDLLGYTQCHFFAGIGVWSRALRSAGWSDDRQVWTGSCPCQPFSAAGKGKGLADERHLWPAFFHLIEVCGPVVVFGEQVAGKDGLGWLDLVSTDLEAVGYTCGAVPAPAAGFGAPHIRERLYWVADANGCGQQGPRVVGQPRHSTAGADREEHRAFYDGRAGGMADHELQQRQGRAPGGDDARGWQQEPAAASGLRGDHRPGPTNGFWGSADWLGCRDGKWRPVEPGTQPLAHGVAARVGRLRGASIQEHAAEAGEARVMRLRGYGNGLVAQQAKSFVEAYMDVRDSAV